MFIHHLSLLPSLFFNLISVDHSHLDIFTKENRLSVKEYSLEACSNILVILLCTETVIT